MIFEEVPLRLCVNELASVLLHQCGLSSLCIGETTTVVNPITTLVLFDCYGLWIGEEYWAIEPWYWYCY